VTSVHKLLKNVYYIGIVQFMGRRYPGRHEPLIDQDTFDRVQMLLAANDKVGDHAWQHRHYLRGMVVCEECESRLLFSRHRNRHGVCYEHFSCTNRASRKVGKCRGHHYRVEDVERRIIEH
jgi:site-specific DNA recombinase